MNKSNLRFRTIVFWLFFLLGVCFTIFASTLSPLFGFAIGMAVIFTAAFLRDRLEKQQRRRSTPMSQFVANLAMRRANYVVIPGRPGVCDIGLLVYHSDEKPDVYRRKSIPGSATYLRPFVMLNALVGKTAAIRFELLDAKGVASFVAEETAQLKRGQSFVTSTNWLPLEDADSRAGLWSLRVTVDGRLAALHPFTVKPPYKSELGTYIDSDGEISEQLDADLEISDEPLSLDALLKGKSGIKIKNIH